MKGSVLVGIICHDAGGASIIASYLLNERKNYLFHLDGPAIKIFQEIYGEFTQSDYKEIFKNINHLYVGSSVTSNLEYLATAHAKSLKIRVTVFMDHWTLYEDRFERNGNTVVPDEIIVTDDLAEKLIHKVFPKTLVTKIDNPHILFLKKQYNKLKHDYRLPLKKQALWLSDPFDELDDPFSTQRNKGYRLNFTELEAFEWFIKRIKKKFPNIEEIVIRPHPSETKNKFDENYKNQGLRISISRNENSPIDSKPSSGIDLKLCAPNLKAI